MIVRTNMKAITRASYQCLSLFAKGFEFIYKQFHSLICVSRAMKLCGTRGSSSYSFTESLKRESIWKAIDLFVFILWKYFHRFVLSRQRAFLKIQTKSSEKQSIEIISTYCSCLQLRRTFQTIASNGIGCSHETRRIHTNRNNVRFLRNECIPTMQTTQLSSISSDWLSQHHKSATTKTNSFASNIECANRSVCVRTAKSAFCVEQSHHSHHPNGTVSPIDRVVSVEHTIVADNSLDTFQQREHTVTDLD